MSCGCPASKFYTQPFGIIELIKQIMGACTPSVAQEDTYPVCGFYGEILNCPQKHWLAFYETS